MGTLDQLGGDVGIDSGHVWSGQRICPDPSCKGLLFVVIVDKKLAIAYPPISIDFDSKNISPDILHTFEEAIDCHANKCYTASAIMIRRTLEEICADKKAKGKDLHQRLADLKSKIVLPVELLNALDELKLLGNDAAQIEAKTFSNISAPELSVAIKLTSAHPEMDKCCHSRENGNP